ncbi:zonular occludens toxin domain-containing protein [uncultured Pseudoxanthomonas sp.]|uniref:zonular occludens toxin domain-containing protein n=1 Tax=uncultured Pseudoxanthomonas sp. TaxID=281701 RepID=UPI0025915C6C|nr:zonular occludens toxin domain-containing protein [uncultured Pseudoxanthomonas sp.]
MLYLLTGSNGAGKSLRSVWQMRELLKEGRDVYWTNYRGFGVRLAITMANGERREVKHFPDAREWKQLPPNSVLFIDEAQQIMPSRRGGKSPPEFVTELDTHRSRGIDIYMTTPSPMKIDSEVRSLFAGHFHLIAFGDKQSRVFRFSECQEDPQSSSLRSQAAFELWAHPQELYGCYDSSEQHLTKAKPPWRQRIAKLLFVGAALLAVWVIYALFFAESEPTKPSAPSSGGLASMFGGGVSRGRSDAPRFRNAQEYLRYFTPRVPEAPWSMPAADATLKAKPALYCISSGAGLDGDGRPSEGGCRCLTEQGTRYVLPRAKCEVVARTGGAYNPYLDPATPTLASASSAGVPTSGQLRIMYIMFAAWLRRKMRKILTGWDPTRQFSPRRRSPACHRSETPPIGGWPAGWRSAHA